MTHKSYYWVRLRSNSRWEPARFIKLYDDEQGHWELVGEDFWRDFSDVEIIGPELVPPPI